MQRLTMFPPDPDFPLIHTRRYEVRAYRMAEDRFMLRGVVCDEKPAGLYIDADPDPLWIHHMIVDLEIEYPSLRIDKAHVEYHSHPHFECTNIVPHYQKLEGLSIARGFNAKVKELFAGPRGCTHITALLSAMAPVAVQTQWSMRMYEASQGVASGDIPFESDELRKRRFDGTINTCHVWDEDGRLVDLVRSGAEIETPVAVSIRLKELGRSEDGWRRMHG